MADNTTTPVMPAVSMFATLANPIAGLVGTGIEALLSWYGSKKQESANEKNLAAQQAMYNQQRADERYMFDTNLAEGKRVSDRNYSFQESQATQQNKLANKQLGLTEKQIDYSMASAEKDRAIAEKDKKLSDQLTLMNNLAGFFNTPEVRAKYAALWR